MNPIVTVIPAVLQTLFDVVAPALAISTHFIRRQRTLDTVQFARTFSLFLVQHPKASFQLLANQLSISASALCQRFEQRSAACFMKALLFRTLSQLSCVHQPPTVIDLLSRFQGVYVADCTTISLPKSLIKRFPGCGGGFDENGKNAAVKILLRTRLDTGEVTRLLLRSSRTPDNKMLRKLPKLPKGALHIADLGFFDTGYFQAQNDRGVYWLTRLPARISVCENQDWKELADWLEQLKSDQISSWDGLLRVNRSSPMKTRVILQRCPQTMASSRRRKLHQLMKSKGKTAGRRQLILCDWWVLATNAAEEKMSASQATELYRSRWQIELIFKRWKSLGKLGVRSDLTANRAECELYGRLMGVLIVHWIAILQGGPLSGVSPWQVWQAVLDVLDLIRRALQGGIEWNYVLGELMARLRRIPKQPNRKKAPSTRQRLASK